MFSIRMSRIRSDPLEQAEIYAADARHWRQPSVRMPDKGVGGRKRLRAVG